MTKKKGYLLEQVANIENLRLAVKNSQRGGKAKRSWQIKKFNEHRDTNLLLMQNMVLRLSFPEHNSRKLQRRADKNKIRDLDDEDYLPWKVMSHAIMQVIEPIVIKMLIADTSCCVPGRGCLYGVKRMKKLLRRNPEYTWAAQSDCKKYYQSISPEYMERVLRHKFKDRKFVKLVLICVFDYYCGEAIETSIRDEQAKKERSANWRVHQRTDWQPQPQRDRPHPHGAVSRQAAPKLRRYGDVGEVKGRGQVSAQRLRQAGGRERYGCKGE